MAPLSTLLKIFRRKKPAPLACIMSIDNAGQPLADDPKHVHTEACFIQIEPLAVVELFQSQGCQACPPVIPNVLEATMSPNVVLLSYNVTHFDHLGWKDTFGNTSWDRRQREYVMKWSRNSIFTPQIIVNGVVDGNGAGGKSEMMELVASARMMQKSMDWHIYLDANDTDIRIDTDKAEAETHDILVVVYRGSEEVVKVGKGPNKGKKIKHRNVVKQVMKFGEWNGGDMVLALPAPKSSMKHGEEAVVMVQASMGGPIIAAVKL